MEPIETETEDSVQPETELNSQKESSPAKEIEEVFDPDTSEISQHDDHDEDREEDKQNDSVIETPDDSADPVAAEFDAVDDEEDADDDDDDDIVNVIIKPSNQGSIYKTGVTYQARSHVLHTQVTKPTRQGVNLSDPGNIQGVPTMDFNLSTLGDEEKPWKRPGTDITDYFNYGFTEETWTQYCEKQKIIRHEYANSTIKPLLVGTGAGMGYNGLSLAQRNRFVGLSSRPFDSYKSASNINVINLSSNPRSGAAGLLSPNHDLDSDDEDLKSNHGVSDGAASTAFGGPGFSMPPPGYPGDQSAALAQLNTVAAAAAANAFNLPPPVFGNTAAAASGVFPNTAVPPPSMSANLFAHQQQSAWPPSSVNNGLISLLSGPGVRHTGHSGRMNSDLRGPTPEDLFSDDEYHDSRRRRYNAEEETDDRYDRDQYRSSRRSRSRSREKRYSSRSKRHHEDSSSREYSRHGERSHRRSRDHHHSRSDRNSLGISESISGDYLGEGGGGSSRRSRDRSSVHRDLRRSDRESRDPGGASSRSSRRHKMSSRSPDRIISFKRGRSPLSRSNSPQLMRRSSSPEAHKQPIDPLTAAAAAAADIAARLSRGDGDHMFG